MYERGDVISVDFGSASKVRPALVISNDSIASTGNLIIAMITSRQGQSAPTVPLTRDVLTQPLPKNSLVRCHRLYTIDSALVKGRYSQVNTTGMKRVFDTIVSIID